MPPFNNIMKLKKLSKQEAMQQIKEIFSGNPADEKIKKAKKTAMSKNIKLGAARKLFCKKCSFVSRWKLN